MEEPEASALTRKWLEEQGYKVKDEVGVSGTQREVVLDYFAYREVDEPEILWVEVKGDQPLSQLLEGFIRTEFAVHYGGGRGMLACPNDSTKKLLKHRAFLKQAEGVIEILDIEKRETHQL